MVLASASGAVVRDVDGNEYVDCLAGAGALALGHRHPVVAEALQRALADGVPLTTLDLSTPLREAYLEQLFGALPPAFADGRALFCGPSGADAVEAAVKLAKTATGRGGMLAFGGGYHGMTQATLALSGGRAAKAPLGALGEVQHLPFPSAFRCPLGAGEASGAACARVVEWLLSDEGSGVVTPAAVVVEPVQGEGGVQPMPADFAHALRRATREAGVLLIADEVQTGLGRTGELWASEALDPDVLVLSKAVGGGLPLALIVFKPELDVWQPGAHAGTFRGNQLAFAAGAATIEEVVRARLDVHAAALGARLRDGLRAAAGGVDAVGDVRGRGLMVGAELVDPDALDRHGVPVPDGTLARAVQRGMLERGVIVELGGRADAVVRFLPPLIVSEAQIDQVVEAFDGALREALAGREPAACAT